MEKVAVITIDGPAASGKGTIAQRVAKTLGFHYLDSGALYRIVTFLALQKGLTLEQERAIVQVARSMHPQFIDGQIFVDGQNITQAIRTEEVSRATSCVAAISEVRKALLDVQKAYAKADGRDMGTTIFPRATLKVFLTASVDVRTERRALQLEAKGLVADRQAMKRDLEIRDQRDRERADSPLKPAQGAYILDTSDLTIEEVEKKILNWWSEVAQVIVQ